jgi:hypothetical protein
MTIGAILPKQREHLPRLPLVEQARTWAINHALEFLNYFKFMTTVLVWEDSPSRTWEQACKPVPLRFARPVETARLRSIDSSHLDHRQNKFALSWPFNQSGRVIHPAPINSGSISNTLSLNRNSIRMRWRHQCEKQFQHFHS